MKHKIILFLIVALMFGFTLTGCTSTPANYDISVYINGAVYGRVNDEVSGTYPEGTELTIVATPYENQTFFCWMLDNKVVSTSQEYTFEVSEQTSGSYVALFNCSDLEYISLESFNFTNAVTQNSETQLKSFSIYFGHTQNDLYKVFTSTNNNISSASLNTLYGEDQYPYTFDKTRNIYIKIEIVYESENIEYKSETIKILNACQIGETPNNLENETLNGAYSNLTEQTLENSQNSKISITFKELDTFEFTTEEENV